MKRRARIEKRLILPLADGSTVTLDPGFCWIDESGENPVLTWTLPGGTESAAIIPEELAAVILRRDFVYTSW